MLNLKVTGIYLGVVFTYILDAQCLVSFSHSRRSGVVLKPAASLAPVSFKLQRRLFNEDVEKAAIRFSGSDLRLGLPSESADQSVPELELFPTLDPRLAASKAQTAPDLGLLKDPELQGDLDLSLTQRMDSPRRNSGRPVSGQGDAIHDQTTPAWMLNALAKQNYDGVHVSQEVSDLPKTTYQFDFRKDIPFSNSIENSQATVEDSLTEGADTTLRLSRKPEEQTTEERIGEEPSTESTILFRNAHNKRVEIFKSVVQACMDSGTDVRKCLGMERFVPITRPPRQASPLIAPDVSPHAGEKAVDPLKKTVDRTGYRVDPNEKPPQSSNAQNGDPVSNTILDPNPNVWRFLPSDFQYRLTPREALISLPHNVVHNPGSAKSKDLAVGLDITSDQLEEAQRFQVGFKRRLETLMGGRVGLPATRQKLSDVTFRQPKRVDMDAGKAMEKNKRQDKD